MSFYLRFNIQDIYPKTCICIKKIIPDIYTYLACFVFGEEIIQE